MTTPTAATRFLVIGAGELGMAMLRGLTQRITTANSPDTITVLLRPPATTTPRRHDITTLGADITYTDIASATITELADTMADYDTVISCLGFAAGRGTQLKLAHAALTAAVPRFLPWQFGVDYDLIGRGSPQDLFDEQLDVRDLLRAQHHTTWIIVSTGMFTSFLFDPAFGVVDPDTDTVHALGDWDTAVTLTTPEDIGIITTEIVYQTPPLQNRVIHIAGDTITYRQLADILDDTRHTTHTRIRWPLEQLHTDLAADPTNTMKKYRAVFAQGIGVAWPKGHTFNTTHAIPTTTAHQWARENLSRQANRRPR